MSMWIINLLNFSFLFSYLKSVGTWIYFTLKSFDLVSYISILFYEFVMIDECSKMSIKSDSIKFYDSSYFYSAFSLSFINSIKSELENLFFSVLEIMLFFSVSDGNSLISSIS